MLYRGLISGPLRFTSAVLTAVHIINSYHSPENIYFHAPNREQTKLAYVVMGGCISSMVLEKDQRWRPVDGVHALRRLNTESTLDEASMQVFQMV